MVGVAKEKEMIDTTQSTSDSITAGDDSLPFVFTIAARNYLGQVSVLLNSVRKQCGDIQFCCFVVDGYDEDADIPEVLKSNVFDCRKLGIPTYDFEEMACKYTVVEFSTALKPFIFKYIFEQLKFASAIYLDPDIKLFNNINWIVEELNSKSILLTPHLLDFEAYKLNYTGRAPALDLNEFLFAGAYNLGFVAIKYDPYGKNFIDLWAEILRDQCFADRVRSLCYDQKWVDFLSSFFGERIGVISDAGANVAYWNLHERNLSKGTKSNYFVNGSSLKFVHFSNIDLIDKDGIAVRAPYKKINLVFYPEYRELFTTYKDELKKASFKERMANIPYRYNYFDNGLRITKTHREIYAQLLGRGCVPSPFSVPGEFYCILKEKELLGNNPEFDIKAPRFSGFIFIVTKLVSATAYVSRSAFLLMYKLVGPRKYLLLLKKLRNFIDIEINKLESI
jgi:hypothetical protein